MTTSERNASTGVMETVNLHHNADAVKRALQLEKLSKAALVRLWNGHNRHTWTLHPVTTWTKDEIAWDIVEVEFAHHASSAVAA